ncbi:hypothetical protein Aglo03_32280 [Actinokineospora globicatena]|uniref:Uncharacterized protein n=1 Tax=Actinokineospora globicatena TaxID=103729 RepID=A0A9W6QMQ3_9PSEU|nr:hypothetical protein Aglo03_32280 [Actinokineospora globicatena]
MGHRVGTSGSRVLLESDRWGWETVIGGVVSATGNGVANKLVDGFTGGWEAARKLGWGGVCGSTGGWGRGGYRGVVGVGFCGDPGCRAALFGGGVG